MKHHFLNSARAPKKGRNLINCMAKAAEEFGLKVSHSWTYEKCDVLITYGMGGDDRFAFCNDHIANGGKLIAFDLGYWDRNRSINERKYRVSLGGFHPSMVMEGPRPPSTGFDKSGLTIARSSKLKSNNILLIGNAPKSIAVGASGWTAKKSKEIRTAFPNAKIIYRPKPKRPRENGVIYDAISSSPIESALKSCWLVVCRHSNVAVDACRMGVPVVCDDGAAAAIYPQRLEEYWNQPSYELRQEFLHRLAYWQWSANEAPKFWNWLSKAFPSYCC